MKLTQSQQRGMLYVGLGLMAILLTWATADIRRKPPEVPANPQKSSKTTTVIGKLDLNAVDSTQLDALPGIGPVLASRILRYKDRIGHFNQMEDLLQVFGIREGLLVALEEKLCVEEGLQSNRKGRSTPRYTKNGRDNQRASQNYSPAKNWHQSEPAQSFSNEGNPEIAWSGEGDSEPESYKNSYAKATISPVDINRADSVQLLAIPGIGPKTAGRLLKYRRLLGFFRDKSQVKEVWGVSPANYARMEAYLQVGLPPASAGLPINSCTVKELGRHPYIDWKSADILIAYRDQHGPFSGPEALDKILGVEASTIEKIRPYLSFE